MRRKAILTFNYQKFLDDIKRATEVYISPHSTSGLLKATKTNVYLNAETRTISYYMTDDIFIVKRLVMVIY